MIKGREVRERLKGKVNNELIYIIEAIAEDSAVVREENLKLAKLVDELIDNYTQLAIGFGNLSTTPAVQQHLAELQKKHKAQEALNSIRKGDKTDGMDS